MAAADAATAEDTPVASPTPAAVAVAPEALQEADAATTSSSSTKSAEEQTAALLAQIRAEVARRRNFAIISHPVSAAVVVCGGQV